MVDTNNSPSATADTINLILCLYNGNPTVKRNFKPGTTLDELQQEMRQVFNIDPEREVQLLINSSVYNFKAPSPDWSLSANDLESSSPIKPPPTPPPMPSSSSNTQISASSSTVALRNSANPNKITAISEWLLNSKHQESNSIYSGTSTIATTSQDDPSRVDVNAPIYSPTKTLAEICSEKAFIVVTIVAINQDGTWPNSKPRFTPPTRSSKNTQPGLCGLANMGNTCFMNAALQCLSNTPALTKYILTNKFVDDINTCNPIGRNGEIARSYAQLIKVMWSGDLTSYLPREFKSAVGRFAPQFTGFSQQDCQELMAFLLDGLHEDLNRIRQKPYIEVKSDIDQRPDNVVADESWLNYKRRNDSIVVDTFHAMLKSTLVCPGCKLVSVTFDPFCYLSLPLPVKRERNMSILFVPAPRKLDSTKIRPTLSKLDQEEVENITMYGGSISSYDGSIEEQAGNPCIEPYRTKRCQVLVPRSGPASEICEIVAQIINNERGSQADQVSSDNLIVAELNSGKISKIYEPNEHYNLVSDEMIIIVEKSSTYVLPLYIRERKQPYSAAKVVNQPVFLHVHDLKFETLYKSIISSLSNLTEELEMDAEHKWHKIKVPENFDHQSASDSTGRYQMDLDEDEEADGDNVNNTVNNSTPKSIQDSTSDDGDEIVNPFLKLNGKSKLQDQQVESVSQNLNNFATNNDITTATTTSTTSSDGAAFSISIVNSLGNHTIEKLGPNSTQCDYSSKLYLGVTFSSETLNSPQFQHCNPQETQKFWDVDTFMPKVSLKPTLQLKDCITQFTSTERLGAEDPWYCPKCKKHQQATKKFDIWSLPEVLIIHLKRFSFSRSWRDKIDTLVEFPVENLDMSQYVLNPKQKNQGKLMYDLIGVANHYGGLGGGHYTAYAKNDILNAWYSFDDAVVTPTSSSNVVTRSAYVLFYQLQGDAKANVADGS